MLEVLQHPHPLLRQACAQVEHFDSSLAWIAQQMILVMQAHPARLIGLAANQVGERKRMIVVLQGKQHIVMVNPVILRASGQQRIRDGCASVQHGTLFRVRTRPAFVQVQYQDLQGNSHNRKAKGIHAAAIDHEIDHLNGVLFIDHLAEAG
jgi:peptide deformylase